LAIPALNLEIKKFVIPDEFFPKEGMMGTGTEEYCGPGYTFSSTGNVTTILTAWFNLMKTSGYLPASASLEDYKRPPEESIMPMTAQGLPYGVKQTHYQIYFPAGTDSIPIFKSPIVDSIVLIYRSQNKKITYYELYDGSMLPLN